MSEYSMYVCPKCKKVFKTKGTSKKIKCPKCEYLSLSDMCIDAEEWGRINNETKKAIINKNLEKLEEKVTDNSFDNRNKYLERLEEEIKKNNGKPLSFGKQCDLLNEISPYFTISMPELIIDMNAIIRRVGKDYEISEEREKKGVVEYSVNYGVKKNIHDSSEELTSYIKLIYEMEQFLYEQALVLTNIDDRVKQIKDEKPIEILHTVYPYVYGSRPVDLIRDIADGFTETGRYGDREISAATMEDRIWKNTEGTWSYKTFLALITYIIAFIVLIVVRKIGFAILFFIIGGIAFLIIKAKCNSSARMEEYTRQAIIENERRETKSKEKRKKNTILKRSLLEEYLRILDIRDEVKGNLKKLYNAYPIYEKYQGLVCMSTFYDYFASGRCSTMKEAYNLYESERFAHIIISKLDGISDKLEDLKDGQYALYKSVEQANKNLASVSCQIDKCVDGVEDIRKNSEIIEYNSKCIAQTQYFTGALLGYITTKISS